MVTKVLFLIVWLGLVLFVVVGCMVGATAVMPTATAVAIAPATNTPTLTPKPTATPQPTTTLTFTPLPTATNTPTPTPTETETLTPTATLGSRVVVTSVSSQGNWTAETLQGYFGGSEEESSLIRVSSSEQEWIADTPTEEYGLVGLKPPIPLSWSNDEKFFFFTHRRGADGCVLPGNGWKVFRLDLTTGIVEEVPTDAGYWYAPSLDGLRLAYVFNKGAGLDGIRLLDIETGTEQEIQLDFASLHDYVTLSTLTWSPTNDGLLVIATVDVCLISETLDSLLYIDLKTFQQKTLLEEYGELERNIEWIEPEKALLEFYDGRMIWVDIVTGELTPAEE